MNWRAPDQGAGHRHGADRCHRQDGDVSAHAAVTVQSGVLSKVMEKGGSRLGIFSSSVSQKPLGNPYLSVDVVVDTPEMQSQLAGLDDAPVLLKPWIQPID